MNTLNHNNNLYREILSPLDQFEIRDLLSIDAPAVVAGKHTMWVKLSNSGDLLKLLVPNYSLKTICGWINHSCIPFSLLFDKVLIKKNTFYLCKTTLALEKGSVTSQKISSWRLSRSDVIKNKFHLFSISEKIMEYRGSKSVIRDNIAVKEQRVDGSCTGNKFPVLRCTLMGFEKNYQVKIPSDKIFKRQYSTNKISQRVSFVVNSTCNCCLSSRRSLHLLGLGESNDKLTSINPFFITGFTDAEGSFMISIVKYPGLRTGWKVQARFVITQHERDLELIKEIQSFFTLLERRRSGAPFTRQEESSTVIGNIDPKGKDQIHLRITSLEQITNVIIPHFEKYPLITQKKADFYLFKLAVNIMNNKEHLTSEGLQKIVNIKASMNKGLSKDLVEAFPNTMNYSRPLVEGETIKDPYWLAGFVTGEGCFHVRLRETPDSSRKYVELIFTINQHTSPCGARDESLMRSFVDYLGCGRLSVSKRAIYYTCSKFSDISEKILPFFRKHEVLGVKSGDLNCLWKIREIIKSKRHLTNEGFNHIRIIKASLKVVRPVR